MNQRFATSDGLNIAYDVTGRGPALICLAGLTRNRTDFDYVLPNLTGVTTVRMDYRGRGKSDWAADPTSYTIPREAQDALELLDHLGIARAAVLGTSRGGLIAMTLGVTARDRLRGVLLNDIGPEVAEVGLRTIESYVGRDPEEQTFAAAEDARAILLPGFANVPEGRWAEEVRRHYVATPEGLQINYDPALRVAFQAALAAPPPDLWPLFDSLRGLPLAALRGANSNILTARTFAEMRRRRPDMVAATVPDRGHAPFLDEVESIRVVNDFLDMVR